MIDTLSLRLNDIEIKPGAKLEIEGGRTNFETGEVKQALLFRDTTGKEAFGSSAYCNTDNYNFDIKSLYGNGVGYFVHFSAPKQINENNYSPITESELSEAIQKVEQGLADNGINTKLDRAKITRLDCFKNTLPDEPIECYSRVFDLLNAKYVKDKRSYPNGWLYPNSRVQYCIYSKLEEMLKRKENISGYPETLRFEHRVIHSNKIKSFYNFTTIAELKAVGFQALLNKQRDTWRNNFFIYSPDEIEVKAESQLRNEMEYFQAKYGNRFFSKYLKVVGAQALCLQAGGLAVVKRALENMACNRMRIWRAEKELNEALFEIENMKVEPVSLRTLRSLYIELKEKVLA